MEAEEYSAKHCSDSIERLSCWMAFFVSQDKRSYERDRAYIFVLMHCLAETSDKTNGALLRRCLPCFPWDEVGMIGCVLYALGLIWCEASHEGRIIFHIGRVNPLIQERMFQIIEV